MKSSSLATIASGVLQWNFPFHLSTNVHCVRVQNRNIVSATALQLLKPFEFCTLPICLRLRRNLCLVVLHNVASKSFVLNLDCTPHRLSFPIVDPTQSLTHDSDLLLLRNERVRCVARSRNKCAIAIAARASTPGALRRSRLILLTHY